MGWLKKHLNPNPIKQVKAQVSDVRKVAKVAMKVDPALRMGVKKDPIARKVLMGNPKKAATIQADNKPTPRSPATVGYSSGQGNAPAPRPYTPSAPVAPPVPAVRKTAARRTLSTLGAGKYRIK